LLLPAATIGNWIGGAVFMATLYAFVYGKPAKDFAAWVAARDKTHPTADQQHHHITCNGWGCGGKH
jgi:hypothetical protein